jgi:dipeptidyl aminopeptidase/acylaminoacyl peptidase
MRWCLSLTLGVLLLGCESRHASSPPASSPSALQDGRADYASARTQFKTKLLRQQPAPEPASAVHFSKLKKPAEVERVEYPSGGLRLQAWTQSPSKAGTKLPAVLFLHGGWGFDEGDWEHTKPFRDAGYVVLAPMVRGENGCPGAFTMFYDEVDDVVAAGAYLAGLPHVDPQRVYLAGYSAGGTLTMLAAMATDRFRAAASLDGSPDRRAFIRGREDEVPFDLANPEEFRMRSPRDFATSFRCPIRLYCSQDVGAYLDETKRLAVAAKGVGLDAEMVEVPGNHSTFRLPATKLAIQFFQTK